MRGLNLTGWFASAPGILTVFIPARKVILWLDSFWAPDGIQERKQLPCIIPLNMTAQMKRHRRFPWLEIIMLIGLGIIFGVTFWQYKGAQRDLQKHQEEMQPEPPMRK